jgi:hypothetical protein
MTSGAIRTSAIHSSPVRRKEITPMLMNLSRALDVIASILIVILTVGVGAATAVLQA